MTQTCPSEFLELAHRLADAAGDVIRPLFRREIDIISKDDSSPVTIADRNAEMAMRNIIEAEFPEHGIYGEEHGQVRLDAEYVWVLDPIDGTHSFISGMPTFTCLIGLVKNCNPIMGIMYQPITGEKWVGANGATTLNGTPIHVRDTAQQVSKASLFSYGIELFDGERGANFKALCDAAERNRFGYDSYAYGLLAHGFIDIVADSDMKPFDYCALVPIVENAGGSITDWDGNKLTLANPGYVLASANENLHKESIKLLSSS
ncbi:MAG: hypothetical protein JKX94_06615 [Sneathiella sp.]|nr:hypothetical protein [Sneathiella sp.]